MSARVLNPIAFNDFHHKIVRSPPNIHRDRFDSAKLERIKRDLFGTPDPIETKQLFESEIKKQQEIACQKWGFDFLNGKPLSETTQQYIWERVQLNATEFMPAVYTLTRAAHTREINDSHSEEENLIDEKADRENHANSSLESITSEEDDDNLLFKVPSLRSSIRLKSKANIKSPTSSSTNQTISCIASLGKRQPRITEFMKERKRLISASPKKYQPPAKRQRINSPPTATITSSSSLSGRFHFRSH